MTSKDSVETFPARLREARERSGWTLAQLADEAGLHTSAIGHLEAGAREPRLSTLAGLSLALDCPIDYLAGLTDDELPVGRHAKEVAEVYEGLSAKNRRLLVAIGRVLAAEQSNR